MNVSQLANLLNSVVFLIVGLGIFIVLVKLSHLMDKLSNTLEPIYKHSLSRESYSGSGKQDSNAEDSYVHHKQGADSVS
jgi:hypothetical protein